MGKKRKKDEYCIFVFGAKKMKGISRRSIEAALTTVVKETEGTLRYVVMGNTRETEKVAYSLCRKKALPVAILPADFESFSYNAEHLRNGSAFTYFQPTKVVMIHTEPEEDITANSVLKWATKNQRIVVRVPKVVVEK